jgi:YidC/Oxa1 family membrane protein insertase
MMEIFRTILFQPLFNALIFFYNLTGGSLGVAVILLTASIRVLFFPLFHKSLKSQMALSKLQPELEKIKKKYPKKDEQMRKIMEFYKEKKINPMSGCLPILIQLPILIALYQVFLYGFDPGQLNIIYSFLARPESIDPVFLNLINLSQKNFILAALAGISQFWQAKMITPQSAGAVQGSRLDFAGMMSRQMLYLGPFLTLFILMSLPSVVAIYWLVSNIISILQQYLVKSNLAAVADRGAQ